MFETKEKKLLSDISLANNTRRYLDALALSGGIWLTVSLKDI